MVTLEAALLWAGVAYFLCMATVHVTDFKVPVLFVYFNVSSTFYQQQDHLLHPSLDITYVYGPIGSPLCMQYIFFILLFFFPFSLRQHANLADTLSGHSSWVLSVAFSPDNQHFATG